MSETESLPPLPEPIEEDAPYWHHLGQGRLHFQRCGDCRAFTHPPALHCAHCGSPHRQWHPAPAEGTLFSFTIAYRSSHRAFRDAAPYNIVLVEFPEWGVRMVGNAVQMQPEELNIGMRLEVFVDHMGGFGIPRFRRAPLNPP